MPEPTPIPMEQLQFALPPVHQSVDEERAYRKERLAGALRLFGAYGYEEGVSGHLTARDPEFADCFWVNPFGAPFDGLAPDELILVNGEGQVVDGRHHVNQAAFAVHAQVHRARPDVVAVAHTHSVHGRALSALGELIEPLTQESCAFYEDHVLYDAYTGVVVDEEEGRRIAAALGGHKAIVLRNHGLLTVGDSVDAAAWWFIALERSCQVQLAARAAGKPVLIEHRDAVATREQLGSDLVAWINYQPLWRRISRTF
ncbi:MULTISPECIES: class II aldolase/adducin family protein [unclassified Streptomyces]|uniref:class II aldolase/adducin family protein n=1 Tax=unclassified Streptomyces TaxID=2593676 RepID=UPI0022548959|nr:MULTISPECIES: class II aldolase/adducin family protein [unclassified Streptomyces]WSU22289.1 class II aldolase/adducin family protein [Streptomyces sp. NBC_01108]MCX4788784.1 class II aldolase/adducin family protein [Streptomyces sp. NBC_01221]MCX4795468.1 class II aldolase/adducin family protein [Streptomyces sp. NBC_01242]WSJ36762.1 class II aldolase/adducin family protein [Streptomyces sp. NBC_01321]WSP63180.1 class II aldolase/adducin family protein [Streptomyces sp. NBC_01240]